MKDIALPLRSSLTACSRCRNSMLGKGRDGYDERSVAVRVEGLSVSDVAAGPTSGLATIRELSDFALPYGVRDQSQRELCHHKLPRRGTGIRPVTTNEPAAPAGENRRTAGETCSLLLAALGRESSDEAVVYGDGAAD